MSSSVCAACGSTEYHPFLEVPAVPVHVGVLWSTCEEARECARGDVSLAYCERCGFIGNRAFDEARVDYSLRYDNALHFSKYFQRYEDALARRLVHEHDVHGKHVIEIGCGGGRFLGLLCQYGDNRGTGFDPSFDPARADPGIEGRAQVIRDHYGAAHADLGADLVCCRHVLEHLDEPRSFLSSLRQTLDGHRDAVVYVEVPNALFIVRDLSIWDVIYEHCGYWSPATLEVFFRRHGFDVLAAGETYDGQFIGIEARPGAAGRQDVVASEELARIRGYVSGFAAHFAQQRAGWQETLSGLRAAGKRAVVWGAGAKAVSFLNLLDVGEAVDALVDVNPAKQGSHLAGTGHRILAPSELVALSPDLVVILNPAYRQEIELELRGMGIEAEIRVV